MAKVGETERKLLAKAAQGAKNAFVFGGFKVGAAVLGEDGQVYEGCNIQSSISGLGICAERCAIDHAVLHGNRRIREVAMVMEADDPNESRPCGACLQYIHDFAESSRVKVVMAKARGGRVLFGTVDVKMIGELLPFPHRK